MMKEVEIFETLMMSVELSAFMSVNFLAVFVVYIVAAYVLGRKVTGTMAVSMSTVYSLFLIPPFIGVIGNLRRAYDLGNYLRNMFPDSPLATESPMSFELSAMLFVVPMMVAWVGSLYFMHAYVRGKQGRNA